MKDGRIQTLWYRKNLEEEDWVGKKGKEKKKMLSSSSSSFLLSLPFNVRDSMLDVWGMERRGRKMGGKRRKKRRREKEKKKKKYKKKIVFFSIFSLFNIILLQFEIIF